MQAEATGQKQEHSKIDRQVPLEDNSNKPNLLWLYLQASHPITHAAGSPSHIWICIHFEVTVMSHKCITHMSHLVVPPMQQ